jgi:hypothetical protein
VDQGYCGDEGRLGSGKSGLNVRLPGEGLGVT